MNIRFPCGPTLDICAHYHFLLRNWWATGDTENNCCPEYFFLLIDTVSCLKLKAPHCRPSAKLTVSADLSVAFALIFVCLQSPPSWKGRLVDTKIIFPHPVQLHTLTPNSQLKPTNSEKRQDRPETSEHAYQWGYAERIHLVASVEQNHSWTDSR